MQMQCNAMQCNAMEGKGREGNGMYVCMYVRVCVCVCLHLFNLFVYIYVQISLSLSLSLSIYLSICVCIYNYALQAHAPVYKASWFHGPNRFTTTCSLSRKFPDGIMPGVAPNVLACP